MVEGLNCVTCKKPLTGAKKLYCSRTCSKNRPIPKGLERTCSVCTKRLVKRQLTYCSRKCLRKGNILYWEPKRKLLPQNNKEGVENIHYHAEINARDSVIPLEEEEDYDLR